MLHMHLALAFNVNSDSKHLASLLNSDCAQPNNAACTANKWWHRAQSVQLWWHGSVASLKNITFQRRGFEHLPSFQKFRMEALKWSRSMSSTLLLSSTAMQSFHDYFVIWTVQWTKDLHARVTLLVNLNNQCYHVQNFVMGVTGTFHLCWQVLVCTKLTTPNPAYLGVYISNRWSRDTDTTMFLKIGFSHLIYLVRSYSPLSI